jgi:glycosyltransferase involved in cell wall biosynthesis
MGGALLVVEVERRRTLVMLVPIAPADTGNGLAMRGAALARAAGRDHDVHLVVVPVAGRLDLPPAQIPGVVATHELPLTAAGDPSSVIALLRDPRWRARLAELQPLPDEVAYASPALVDQVMEALGPLNVAGVVACRLALGPLGLAVAEHTGAPLVIDADDADERFFAARGDPDDAATWHRVGALCFPRAALVMTASAADGAWLAAEHGMAGRTAEVPNAVVLPALTAVGRPPGERRLLFLGNLTYAPNVEGARWMVEEVMPLLDREVSLDLVGPAASAVEALEGRGVRVLGQVPEVGSHYARADVVVVPLWSGSGTRIKVLEAMAWCRPVVSTSTGLAGIAATDGEHVLVADTAADFARAVTDLFDRVRSDPMVDAARNLVAESYDATTQEGATAQLLSRVTGGTPT